MSEIKPRNHGAEKYIHAVFELGVLFKGIDGLLETAGGAGLLLVSPAKLTILLDSLVFKLLARDPDNIAAEYILKISSHISDSAKLFVALYILAHGVVKLVIVAGLFKNRFWAYPLGITVFSFFVVYQLIRFPRSPSLLILSALDMVFIWLTWHEWQVAKKLA